MLRRASSLVCIACGLLLVALATTVKAEAVRVTAPTDFWYEFTEPTQFEIRTYAVAGFGSDPMLWLYNSEGVLVAQNDDWYGLQSRISTQLQPGWYRLRAGVCCGNPDAWWSGVQYDLGGNVVAIVPTTSSDVTTTTSTVPETTTTTSTTVVETTVVSSTTVQETTTSSTVVIWPSTTTTSTEPPTSVPETTQPLPISSSTTTPQPEETTTTSTTTPPTTTEPSTTTTESPSSSSVSLDPTTTTSSSSSTVLSTPSSSSVPSTTSPTTTTSYPPPPTKLTPTTLPSTTAAIMPPTTASGAVTETSVTSTTLVVSTPEQAVQALVTSTDPEVLDAAIEEIAANLDALTETELEQIAQVVSQAPKEVKEKFESEVNIFGGGLDGYVPVDSNVTVGQRRALVAIGAVLTAAPVLAARRK